MFEGLGWGSSVYQSECSYCVYTCRRYCLGWVRVRVRVGLS